LAAKYRSCLSFRTKFRGDTVAVAAVDEIGCRYQCR
jgi:hypothetical protein